MSALLKHCSSISRQNPERLMSHGTNCEWKQLLVGVRNSHAHGGTNLSNQVSCTFEVVQEILDQLYQPIISF